MNRRMVLVVAAMALLVTILMPIWLPVMLIKPSITTQIQQRAMQAVTRQAIKGMMRV